MKQKTSILAKVAKYSAIGVAVLVITQCVFAISGIRLNAGGEDKGKNANSNSSFSNIKTSVTFSLKDNYGLSSKKTFVNARKGNEHPVLPNAAVSYKKGNVVYILPYKKQNGVKLPNFISIAPQKAGH